MLCIIYKGDKWRDNVYLWSILFLIVGGITTYFDLLTYPLLTLGMPLILWVFFNADFFVGDMQKSLRLIRNIFQLSLFWVTGYGGVWTMKWLIGIIITGKNFFKDAISQMEVRTSSVKEISYYVSFQSMCIGFLKTYKILWIVIGLMGFLYIAKYLKNKMIIRRHQHMMPYVVIAIYPFIWFVVLSNHSFIHMYFTYRELTIVVYAAAIWIFGERETENFGK